MTTDTTSNPLVRMADERRNTLKLLARSANLSHRWAAASAGAAIAHMVAAGHALIQARDLCEEGGWLRWLRRNFEGSNRTAQRYMRVARHLPASGIDATRVSHRSQAAVLRAIATQGNQCLKWRRPVKIIARPCWSQAAVTSSSLREPPG